ncbi:MAG: GAF domain-containing protein, partial [Acidobacteriota bacterium]
MEQSRGSDNSEWHEKPGAATRDLRLKADLQWEEIFQAIGHIALILDPRHRVLAANRASLDAIGRSEEEVLGKTCFELFHQNAKEPATGCPLQRMLVSERFESVEMEMEALGRFFLVSCTPVLERGLLQAVIHIATDITDRKEAEERLRQLNRKLLAISECNQAVVRSTDERQLLEDICRIICEMGGYHMAWVGMAERDKDKSVRPVAWAGVEDGYLAGAAITWADAERGRGPTGTAIRTGETSFFQDYTTDPDGTPWREAALRRGYRSSISLPLRGPGETVLGALTIYATKPNAFTPDEIRLLEGLAENLAYGINTLRTRNERRQAEAERHHLEQQLRQAQKMEAIGTLAGGIAHDFNNILSPIIGYTQLALIDLPESSPNKDGLNQVLSAAHRARELVKQILSFSRMGEDQLLSP